jgi:hypothetical protein
VQGGSPQVGVPSLLGPGVLEVRRSECRGEPTPQMGLFSSLLVGRYRTESSPSRRKAPIVLRPREVVRAISVKGAGRDAM